MFQDENTHRQEPTMIFNWKLETFRRLFGLKKSKKAVTKKLNIENLEERIECATKVWNGSLAGVGTDGTLGPPAAYGVNGDPTFSSFMASIQANNGFLTLGDNWDPTLGQTTLPQNGDTLVFPLLANNLLLTPTSGVFGDLSRLDLTPNTSGPPPGPIEVNLINDLSPDSNGYLAGYLRNPATGINYIQPLTYVDQIFFNGAGYYLYARDNPQFGPENRRISPPNYFPGGETVSAEFFFPGAANDQITPFFQPGSFQIGSTVYVDPATVDPLTNNSYTPAVPLNIQTQLVANYAGSSLINPLDTSAGNANWIYSPINVGNPNLPAGSSFVFNVVQEGSWLILDSDIAESSTTNRPGGYVLLNDVNNNKIVKQGLGILVFEANNQYTGSTSVEQGMLIVSDNNGLGDPLTNSNVEVSGGSLMLSSDAYGTNDSPNIGEQINIVNRNLILNGGDGFQPISVAAGSEGLNIPFGQLTGRYGRRTLLSQPHQWTGTVTLNSSPLAVTTSANSSDIYGVTGSTVNAINVTNGGTGYTSTPTVLIQAPNSALAGQPTITNGAVTAIPVAAGGSGYTFTPTVTITGDGSGATADAVVVNGVVTGINITNGGTGFTTTPTVVIQGHVGATAGNATISSGQITAISVATGGSGYLTAPIVSISGGGGFGATAIANVSNGGVVSITITNPGSGYTSQPNIVIQPPPSGALAGNVVLTNGAITSIAVASGGVNYTAVPLVTIFGGGGSGATAVATLASTGTPANPTGDPSVGQEFGSITEINGVVSGTAGLRKWGAGTVELTQSNTFSGDVVIFDGFLNVQNNLALGVPGDGFKDIVVRELPNTLLAANQQLAGALTLGDETLGGQNLVFGSQYNLLIQDGNPNSSSNNGPDQNPGAGSGFANATGPRVEGLGAFQVVSPASNPNSAEWQGQVTAQTNASIGGSPNSNLLISGQLNAASGTTLEKRGSMNLGISSTNTTSFLGNWLVSNGNLRLLSNGALGSASSVLVTQQSPPLPALSGAGSVQVVGNGLNISNNIAIQGTGFNGFGALQSVGTNSWSGNITLNSTASLGAGAGSELIVSGNILQSNGLPSNSQLIKIGAGTVSLVSPINTTIPIAVQEGTLLVQGRGNLGSGQGSLISVSTSVPTSPATLALAGNKTISNRTLSLDGLGVAGAGALRSISGNNTWAGNINLAGTMQLAYVGIDTGRLTLSGRIDGGSSTLHKTGAGDLVISGNGNSQGSTVVGSGTLYQLGSDNVPVFVNSSGTLTGNGRLGVLRMTAGQNGTVTPGTLTSNVAILNTGGINAQSSVGVFQFDINSQALNGTSPAAGVAYDQLNVTGNVNLVGSPVLSLNLNFQPTVRGITYTIINNDGSDAVVGTFNGLAEGSYITANNVSYQISYRGGDGNDVTLTCVGIVTSNVLTSSDIDNLTKYGQPVTFTSVVSPPVGYSGNVSGTVQFMDQGLPIGAPVAVSGGSASITITNLSVNGSPHVITAVFDGGNSIFATSNSNIIAHTVTKANSSISVSSPTPVYGTDLPLTITATITPEFSGGSATGQVLFRINGVIQPLQVINQNSTDPVTGARTATLLTQISNPGFYSVDALYLGDSNYNGTGFSSAYSQQILTTAVTTLDLVSSRNPADRLQSITFTATVASGGGTPVGLVQFLDNGNAIGAAVPLAGGVASFTTSSLTGGRHVITANYLGAPDNLFTQYFAPSTDSVSQAIQATSNLIVTGTNTGGGPQVNVYNQQNGLIKSFFAFAPEFTGGVRVASGDVTGDSIADVVVAAGPGGGPQVNVYDGANNFNLIRSFYAYDPSFPDGIYVAVGDVNGDGFGDIITGAGAGGGPHVQVFSGANYSNIASFFAFEPTFTGGISVAGGDVNGDGYVDVVIGAGPGGGPRVLAFSGQQLAQSGSLVALANFWAFDVGVNRGVFVAAGDYNGDIVSDIVVSAGPGGGPHVKVFNGSGTNLIDNFFAYDINFAGGVVVAMADIDNDGEAEIVTGPFTNGGPDVRVYKYLQGIQYYFWAYNPDYNGGIYVG